jgi:hypothetical protein
MLASIDTRRRCQRFKCHSRKRWISTMRGEQSSMHYFPFREATTNVLSGPSIRLAHGPKPRHNLPRPRLQILRPRNIHHPSPPIPRRPTPRHMQRRPHCKNMVRRGHTTRCIRFIDRPREAATTQWGRRRWLPARNDITRPSKVGVGLRFQC